MCHAAVSLVIIIETFSLLKINVFNFMTKHPLTPRKAPDNCTSIEI